MFNTTKQETLGNEIAKCGNNTKKLYSLVKHLMGTTSNNPLLKHNNEETLANESADFFIGKIKKITQDLSKLSKKKTSAGYFLSLPFKYRIINEYLSQVLKCSGTQEPSLSLSTKLINC